MLKDIIAIIAMTEVNGVMPLTEHRTILLTLITFYGYLRYAEVAVLRRKDITG